MKSANPYLNFNGNTEEAFAFYRSVFGGDYLGLVRYRDFPCNAMDASEENLDKIAHIALPLGPHNMLMGTDVVSPPLTSGNNFSIAIEADSAEETEQLFSRLSADGEVDMAPGRTDWAETFAACTDRFGVKWMINHTGSVQFTSSGV